MKLSKNKSLIKNQKGFSIVELMIAVFIGIIILTGLVQVFETSSKMNRTQNGLARIQENGRYGISLMKQTIEQTGYQYCMGESNDPSFSKNQPTKFAWDIRSLPFITGFPIGPFDPAYLLHGHECTGSCTPSSTSLGSNFLASGLPVVPAEGINTGDRITGTDAITFRYISGDGREIESISGNTIRLTDWEKDNAPSPLRGLGQLLVVSCDDSAPTLVNRLSETNRNITTGTAPLQNPSLAKAFDMQQDFSTITYYVANNLVDGRDIPTLYNNINGVTNAVIEGVDAFDIIYEVMDNGGGITFLDAEGVQDFPIDNCWPPIINLNNTTIANVAGCAWRSVVSVEVHMLLNTIYNSTNNANEEFRYSQYTGNVDGFYNQSKLPSGINHYSMHRKEFSATISLKNVMH